MAESCKIRAAVGFRISNLGNVFPSLALGGVQLAHSDSINNLGWGGCSSWAHSSSSKSKCAMVQNFDSEEVAPAEPVECQPQEILNQESPVADQTQEPLEQLGQSDDDIWPPSLCT